MNTGLVSVVIPAYNAESFLERAVFSLLNQHFNQLEIVIVNDGSKDKTASIGKSLKNNYKNIIYVEQENKGANKARETGALNSRGDYLVFLDADDYMLPDSINTLYENIFNNLTDIAVFSKKINQRVINNDSYIRFLLEGEIHTGPVAKIFKRSLFDSQTFNFPNNLIKGEDFIMNINLANKAKRIQVFNTPVYAYIRQPLSITKTFKITEEHELSFFKTLEDSLNKQLYIDLIVKQKINSHKDFIWHNVKDPILESELKSEIKYFHIKLPILDSILIYQRSNIIKKIVLTFDKILKKFNAYV